MICTVRRCEEVAVVEAIERSRNVHHYCLDHLWQIEETDSVSLIGDVPTRLIPPSSVVRPVIEDVSSYIPPVTVAEPIYNDQGFSAGFRITHPPDVECSYHPVTKQCSCGKLNIGIVEGS